MKVCPNCHNSFEDYFIACPKCGNPNLQYYPNTSFNKQVGYVPSGYNSVVQVKPKTFFFGDFFKEYFKSPSNARKILIEHKDFGSALLLNAISIVVTFLFIVCLQGGAAINYGMSFSVVLTVVYPILFFIIVFGFQFLDVFLYGLYSKAKNPIQINTALSSYIACSTSHLIPSMIILLASLMSIIHPAIGLALMPTPLAILLCSNAVNKVEYGAKPRTFMDSFMYVLMGLLAYSLTVAIISLFVYVLVRTGVSSLMFDYFL